MILTNDQQYNTLPSSTHKGSTISRLNEPTASRRWPIGLGGSPASSSSTSGGTRGASRRSRSSKVRPSASTSSRYSSGRKNTAARLTKPMFDALRRPNGVLRRSASVMYDEILDGRWDDILGSAEDGLGVSGTWNQERGA
ncbi:hypothetical protein F4825DRAFT_428118 [Nemania diffusa]|nr:hypothetical protein F4825DRAFT_428118 [Nemania diffusa]